MKKNLWNHKAAFARAALGAIDHECGFESRYTGAP